jgi:hypothetical protein
MTCPSQKLDVKGMGPFVVSEVVGMSGLAFRLELPERMRIHNVFHVSLSEPYQESRIVGRVQVPAQTVEVEGEVEWEVKEILDSRIMWGKLLYFVDWVGYGLESRTWEPAEHVEHSSDTITDYYHAYPLRPSPRDVPTHPPHCHTRRS